MSYSGFLAVVVLPPLAFWAWRTRPAWGRIARPLGILLAIVYAVTTPWDNAAVAAGIWGFGEGKTWGLRLGYLPVEEYLFFGLQTLLTGLWVAWRLEKQR